MPDTACPATQRLDAFLQGRLPATEQGVLEQHLRSCEGCLSLAVARKGNDATLHALWSQVRTAEGAAREALVGWIVEKLQASAARQPAAPGGATAASPFPARAPAPPSDAIMARQPLPSAPPPPSGILATAEQPGELGRLGPYRVLQVLGQGGMGVVYLAEDPFLKRQVALKVMLPALAAENEARQRFLREAQAAAAVESDHVIAIHQVGEANGVPYLVMPLLKGESLDEWLRSGAQPSVADMLRLGREIAAGLAAAHDRCLIHRDIKPSNIWLEAPHGRVKILDFGLARPQNDNLRLTQSGMAFGTPGYMSPEQARADKLDHRSDLFSLGAVLYRICTGENPFQGTTVMALLTALAVDAPRPPAELNPHLPPALGDLLVDLLAKEPADRPQSAHEVVERLRAIERSLTGETADAVPLAEPVDWPLPLDGEAAPFALTERAVGAVPGKAVGSGSATVQVRPKRSGPARGLIVAAVLAGLAVSLGVWALLPGGSGEAGGAKASKPSTQQVAPPPVAGQPLPVKVFILAGQSNMAGKALIKTLDWVGEDPKTKGLLDRIRNPDGTWKERDDVWVYHYQKLGPRGGKLTVGFGEKQDEFGPELLFGQVLGDYYANPVLIIKVTEGALNLDIEGRPPSSGPPGAPGSYYRMLLATIRDVLANLQAHYPDYEGQGYELEGFVWFHGWNDMSKPDLARRYEGNLVNLIKDLRKDLQLPNLPVVVGELGSEGRQASPAILTFRKIQAAAVNRPEFQGNVALVKTSAYWDEQAYALLKKGWDPLKRTWSDDQLKEEFDRIAGKEAYLDMGSAKYMAQVGNGFGEAMKDLLKNTKP